MENMVSGVKRGRGRPKGSVSKNKKQPKPIVLINGEKRGRGRPRKDQTNVQIIKPEVIKEVKVVAANIPQLSQQNENTSSEVKRGRGRPKKDGSTTQTFVVSSNPKSKVEKDQDEKFEKEKAQFNLAHTNNGSKFVNIPTLAEIEYQKNQAVKTTAHEQIISEEIQRQKEKAFRHVVSNNSVSKPNLNKHEDAFYINYTDNGRHISLNANVGDELIIEWPQNWRRTETWIIDEINEDNGNVRLKNTEEFYYGAINFITGPTVYGLKIKKPIKAKNEKAKQF